MIQLNPDEISFPDPEFLSSEGGLIAIGGDLSPERIWFAYQNGIFPWFNPGEEILWWFPDPRFVLFPEKLIISKSMKKIIRDSCFSFTKNQCFEEVMESCRKIRRKEQEGSWISDEISEAFIKLHQLGKAHSYESWKDGELVGGFYGLAVGNVFCGESMFAKVSNASKACFINFIINDPSFELIDCQIHSAHLESWGAEMISGKEFLKILKKPSL